MKQYTSCFVGVPLPEKFQKKFESLLISVGKLYPNWELVYPKTPHITVYYLNRQSQYALSEIVLYGVDSTKHPQYQEKLIRILVNK